MSPFGGGKKKEEVAKQPLLFSGGGKPRGMNFHPRNKLRPL